MRGQSPDPSFQPTRPARLGSLRSANAVGRAAEPRIRWAATSLSFALLTLGAVSAAPAVGSTPESFEDFPVADVLQRAEASLQQPPGSLGRKYRSVLGRALSRSPNFAGQYSIVDVGGGSGLHVLLVLDFKTGRAFQAPSLQLVSFSALVEEQFQGRFGMDYRPESRLLIVHGSAASECVGDSFFVFDGADFRLVDRVEGESSWNVGRCALPSDPSFERTCPIARRGSLRSKGLGGTPLDSGSVGWQ